MDTIGLKLQNLGAAIENIGYKIMPLSFLTYFILSYLEYRWNTTNYSKLAKAIWYIAVGIGTLEGDIRIESLITMMIFFDAFDSYMEYKRGKNKK